ncbi:MAG: hypothetical protein ACREBP_09615 [Sphingomicrobium sp.]
MLVTLFRVCGFLGTALLGAALAIAPIAAFEDRMTLVSGLGIAGIVLLLVAWALRKLVRPPADGSDPQP